MVGMPENPKNQCLLGDMKTTAALMLKAPRPGTVKTRLAAEVGIQYATTIYRSLVEHQLSQIPDSWDIAIHFTPSDAEIEMREWLSPYARNASFVPQCPGHLGERMEAAVAHEMASGLDVVALIGGDCPYLTREYLESAANLAESVDVVIGPAADGGYVLLLLKYPHPCLFQHIDWSTSLVLEQTQRAVEESRLHYAMMHPLEDIDDQASFLRFQCARRLPVRSDSTGGRMGV